MKKIMMVLAAAAMVGIAGCSKALDKEFEALNREGEQLAHGKVDEAKLAKELEEFRKQSPDDQKKQIAMMKEALELMKTMKK